MLDETRRAAPEMPSDEAVEKRLYQRLPRAYSVEVTELTFSATRPPTLTTTCCDISQGGVCVEAAEAAPFRPGDTCRVRALIPRLNKYSPDFLKIHENDSEQYFTALAKVAWVKKSDGGTLLGFQFVSTDKSQSHALDKLIKKAFAKKA